MKYQRLNRIYVTVTGFVMLVPALLVLQPNVAVAQGDIGPEDPAIRTGFSGTLMEGLEAVVKAGLTLAGIIAVIFVVIGGFRYVISQGDEGAAKSARNTIIYAVIGLIVILVAGAIVSFVFTNIDGGGAGAADPPGPRPPRPPADGAGGFF